MMFTVLALDYDGTIASDGVLDPEVRRAIADIRERGITVAIVTGRILDDLRRAAGDDRPVRPSRRPVRSPAATSRSRVPRSCAESVPRGWICPQRSSRSGSRPTNAWDGCGRHGHRAGVCVRSPSRADRRHYVTLRPPHALLETVVTWRRNETSPLVEQFLQIARQVMLRP